MSQPTQQDTSPSLVSRPSAPSLAELMSLPPHVTRLLLDLAPFIARSRWLAEVFSWSSPRTSESWLLLAAWWGLCLVTDYSVRYFLPFALLGTLPQLRPSEPTPPQPATEETLHETLEHVARIQTLVPHLPALPTLAPQVVLRVIAIVWIPYVLFMHFIRIRVLLALFGTLLITWRAPWARSLRSVFLSSAFARHGSARLWAVLSGEPLVDASLQPLAPVLDALSAQEHGPSVRFLFTIYENQRWWVGLDWTAALVPSERPSWCAANQQPVAPPSVFALPPTTTVFAPDGKGGRVKRTARWTWEEGEWKVVVRREVNGAPEVRRIEKQPLFVQEDAQSGSKLAMKLKNAVSSSSSQDFGSGLPADNKDGADAHAPAEREEYLTDPDGWTYFDNKWESASNKGGIGKFTRYRRWTRIALLSETIEYVGPGELGIFKENSAPTLQPAVAVNPAVTATGPVPAHPPKDDRPTQDPGSPTSTDASNSLRQRLKAAVHKS